MRTPFALAALSASIMLLVGGLTFAQNAGPVQSLRGTQVDIATPLIEAPKPDKQRFGRAYRQQPPLIPHAVDQYQIDLKANQCLGCHDWTVAGEKNASTLSMSHYLDRDGRQGDQIAGTRWFCNQCHVPQTNAEPLVENTFVPSSNQ